MNKSGISYRPNPHRVPADAALKFGATPDAALVFDSSAGVLAVQTTDGSGDLTGRLSFEAATDTPSLVFNESGADMDVRFEGDTEPNLLFIDGGTDRIGIGTAAPGARLHVRSGDSGGASPASGSAAAIESDADACLDLLAPAANSAAIRFGDPDNSEAGAIVYEHASDALAITVAGAVDRVRITNGPVLFVGDSANTGMSAGITISQASHDNEIIALKSDDVAHGMTALAESDTYGVVSKVSGSSGGLNILGYAEAGDTRAVQINGRGTDDNLNKATNALGYITLVAQKKSGSSVGNTGTNANLAVIANNGTTRFIFDAEGSAHADVEWTTYDAEDDLAALRDFEALMLPDQFGEALRYRQTDFERLGIAHGFGVNSNGRMHAMINWTRLAMLHHGALVQLAEKQNQIEQHLSALATTAKKQLGDQKCR